MSHPPTIPSNAAQLVDPLRASLHDVLIEEPHEIINWGQPLTGVCHDAARQLSPRDRGAPTTSQASGWTTPVARDESEFNHDPTFERMASAWMAAPSRRS